jgi:hypothetical protein
MRRRLAIVIAVVAGLVATTVGIAVAQSGGSRSGAGGLIHVVSGPQSRVQFMDFEQDGLGFGDHLTAVGPLFDETQSHRVGVAYLDCSIVSRVLVGGTFDCTYVLQLDGGDITTKGIDPQGPSDVLFSVTGGTGAYRGASGQAQYIDTDVTDIIIDLDS